MEYAYDDGQGYGDGGHEQGGEYADEGAGEYGHGEEERYDERYQEPEGLSRLQRPYEPPPDPAQRIAQEIRQEVREEYEAQRAEEQFMEDLGAIEEKHPELGRDTELAHDLLEAAAGYAEHFGNPALARDPGFIQEVYEAVIKPEAEAKATNPMHPEYDSDAALVRMSQERDPNRVDWPAA
jgi:hypothetical protein